MARLWASRNKDPLGVDVIYLWRARPFEREGEFGGDYVKSICVHDTAQLLDLFLEPGECVEVEVSITRVKEKTSGNAALVEDEAPLFQEPKQ